MRILIPSLLSFILLSIKSISIFAQTREDSAHHFSLGLSAGLAGDQWNLKSVGPLGEGLTASSHVHLGYSGNVCGVYDFGKHWKLRISAGVQSKKFDYRIDGLHFAVDFNGTGFNDSHIIYNTKATIFTVPVNVEYVWGTKKILPFVSLGLGGEFIIKQISEGTVYYSNGATDPASSVTFLRKSNMAAIAGAGIYYRASNKVSLLLNPVFIYSLLDDAQNNQYQYSFGATAGVFFTPGK